jgi:hypothetical protein
MMNQSIVSVAVVLAVATMGCSEKRESASAASPNSATPKTAAAPMQQPERGQMERQGSSAEAIPVPQGAGATLVGSAAASEIRAFPEEDQRAKGGAHPMVETAVGTSGSDRLYDSNLSYADAVGFFDRTFAGPGYQPPQRTTTKTSTLWSEHFANGEVARVAVRNTNPTTIEIIASDTATAQAPASSTR